LQKADAVKLHKVSDSKELIKKKEDTAMLKLMAEADFSEIVSEEAIFAKLRKK